jgi:hypothetical protein
LFVRFAVRAFHCSVDTSFELK